MGNSAGSKNIKDIGNIITITGFNIWVLASSLFTTVGGVVSLYAANNEIGTCRRGVEIAALVLQCVAELFCVIALIVGVVDTYCKKKTKPFHQIYKNVATGPQRPTWQGTLQAVILFAVNAICIIMVVLIYVYDACFTFAYSAIYISTGVIGSFLISCVTSFELDKVKKEQPDPHETQNSSAGTINQYWKQMQQKQRLQYPVPIRPLRIQTRP
jgi:hypothetical protein